jgi:hypothetical protein
LIKIYSCCGKVFHKRALEVHQKLIVLKNLLFEIFAKFGCKSRRWLELNTDAKEIMRFKNKTKQNKKKRKVFFVRSSYQQIIADHMLLAESRSEHKIELLKEISQVCLVVFVFHASFLLENNYWRTCFEKQRNIFKKKRFVS